MTLFQRPGKHAECLFWWKPLLPGGTAARHGVMSDRLPNTAAAAGRLLSRRQFPVVGSVGDVLRPGVPTPCKWCQGLEGGLLCTGCVCTVHMRGSCRAWNMGANALYLPSPGEPHFLCPDCLWVWAEAWLNCPHQRPVVLSDPELTIHMHNLAGTCSEGAGANSTSDHTSFPSLRRVRRWMLRHISAAHRPACLPLEALHTTCALAMSHGQESSAFKELMERSVSALCCEGKALLCVLNGATCISCQEIAP